MSIYNSAIMVVMLMGMLSVAPTTASGLHKSVPDVYNIRSYGAKGDGLNDDSLAIQSAIDDAFLAGGGIVFIPGSTKGWILKSPILVRSNVTLKGIHAGPADAHFLAANDAGIAAELYKEVPAVPGALMVAQAKYPAITLAENSGIQGIVFAYTDQAPYNDMAIKPYPPMIQIKGYDVSGSVPGIPRTHGIKTDGPISGRSVTIRDVGAINAYHILDIAGENPARYQTAQITVDGLWGYPLSVGVNIQNSLDTVMLHNIQFRPTFFSHVCGEISKSSIGLVLGKTDGCVVSDMLVFGLGIGVLHKSAPGSYQAFSVRVSNANIEAMIPVWMDSTSVDDQVQYTNSFLFNTPFGFTSSATDVYSRKGHNLFPEITYTPNDIAVVRIGNRCEKQTFQSYARFTGCGFHAHGLGPICRIEGSQLVRVTLASSHMVYFRNSVLKVDPGAKVLAIVTGNDMMFYGTNLSSMGQALSDVHLADIGSAGQGTGIIFSENMLQGLNLSLLDELVESPIVTAQGNRIP